MKSITLAVVATLCIWFGPTAKAAIDKEEKKVEEIFFALGEDELLELVWINSLEGWVGKYEITNGQFRMFNAKHICTTDDGGKYLKGRDINQRLQPVVQVGLNEAKAFCDWLNKILVLNIPKGYQFRLPDGEEWMTFSKCGDGRTYPWGNEWPPTYGNYADAKSFSHIDPLAGWEYIDGYTDEYYVSAPVTKSGRNPWGLYGVGGNVWEWTNETLDKEWNGEVVENNVVMRGGSWGTDGKDYLRCDGKRLLRPQFADRGETHVGFRVVLLQKELAKIKRANQSEVSTPFAPASLTP